MGAAARCGALCCRLKGPGNEVGYWIVKVNAGSTRRVTELLRFMCGVGVVCQPIKVNVRIVKVNGWASGVGCQADRLSGSMCRARVAGRVATILRLMRMATG